MATSDKTDSKPAKTPPKDESAAAEKAVDQTQAAVQDAVDDETAKGYHGVKVDPTPNEHYTVGGVIAGLPTPETDPARDTTRAEQRHVNDVTQEA